MPAASSQHSPSTTILLSGSLAKKFGRVHKRLTESGQVWEAFKALRATLEGFDAEINRLDRLGMRFAIFRNRENESADSFELGGTRELRIVPVVSGSKRAGILQTIIGAVIFVASFYVPGMQGWPPVPFNGIAYAVTCQHRDLPGLGASASQLTHLRMGQELDCAHGLPPSGVNAVLGGRIIRF